MITTTTEAAAAATTRGPRGRRQFGASLAGGAPAFRAGPTPTASYPSRLGAPRARPRSARAPRRSRPGLQRFGLQVRAGPPCTFAPPPGATLEAPGRPRTATKIAPICCRRYMKALSRRTIGPRRSRWLQDDPKGLRDAPTGVQ